MTDELFQQEAETAVLSIVLQNPESVFSLLKVKPYMFSSTPYEILYSTMTDMVNNKQTPEVNLLTSYLKSVGKDLQVGGREHLVYLMGLKNDKANLLEYERLVVDSYKARSLLTSVSHVHTSIGESKDINSVISNLRSVLDTLSESSGGDITEKLEDILRTSWNDIVERTKNPGIRGIHTGIKGLDLVTSGMSGGELWIVAGRPGMGKTAQLCNMMLSQGKAGIPTLGFSLEMRKTVLAERLISIQSGINSMDIRLGMLDQKSLNSVSDTIRDLKTLPIYIDSNYNADLGYVLSTIRKYHKMYGVKVAYLDYIQLLAERSNESVHELGKISRSLKLLANELNITCVVLSQFNRELEKRDDKRPLLSDLRQSGNLEEDADVVIGLYRDYLYNKATKKKDVMEEIILKQRNGPTGVFPVHFDEITNRISE